MGQTGRSFELNFEEQFLSLKTNNHNSEFSQYILENGHCFGKIEYMKGVFYYKKERYVFTVEKFYICRDSKGKSNIEHTYV